MIFGVAYYPEHWPEGRWATDAKMMRAAGLQVARLAEFSWAKLEPEPGRFDFDWLDRALNALAKEKLQVILGTPTAAAPAWLVRTDPDTLPVGEDGRRREFGSRRHACPNRAAYREASLRIVQALAGRYGKDPRVIGWQIDNEFGEGNTARCYCPGCAAAFRRWLQARYETLEALNEAWGTVFWSQAYPDWEWIQPPVRTVSTPNPSQVLDYYRFSSDSIGEYQQLQVDALRAACEPRQWITHNFMGLFPGLDQHKLSAPLDFASWDSYPTGNPDHWRPVLYPWRLDSTTNEAAYAFDVGDPILTAMGHDLTRGLKRAPFWVMEQQAGQVNWGNYNPGIRPGTVRLWTWHAAACGAAAVVFFRWRAGLYAQEQYHSGLLNHAAEPATGYADLQSMGAEREQLKRISSQPLTPQVAMLVDYEDLWSIGLQPHRKDFTYLRHLFVFYRALQRLGVQCDLVPPHTDLRGYKLALAPTLHMLDDARVDSLRRYVESGGTLMVGVRSGFKTPTNQVIDQVQPGPLGPLAGVRVREWHSLPPGVSYEFKGEIPNLDGKAAYWAESLEPTSPEVRVLARYTAGPFREAAALTENRVGEGRVVYLGFYPGRAQAKAMLASYAASVGVETLPGLPPGVLAARRDGCLILLNFTDGPQNIYINGQQVTVPGRDVTVIEG